MRIIDRYILASILKIFLGTIFVFSFLYVLIDMAVNLDELIERKVTASILFQYYSTFLPVILVQTSAVGCLIATLFTFSHLNHNNEVVVLRTSGLNFWKITRPALAFAMIVSAFVFWLNEKIVPQADALATQIKNENMAVSSTDRQKNKPKIHNLTFYGLKNRLFFIDAFDPNTHTMQGITIIGYDDEQNILQKIVALNGRWTGIIWKLFQCQVSEFDPPDFRTPRKIKVYEEKLVDIKETPEDFLRQRINVASMNIRQLSEYINKFSTSGAVKALNNLRVDLYQKMAFPVGNVAVVLVGLPFALMLQRRRAVTFTSIGVAMAVGFSYYVLNAVGLAIGKGGLLSPILAAWLAPLIFLLLAFYLIRVKF